MKLRTTVQISSAMQKKPPLKREDSFLKRFSTRQIPEAQETVEDTGSEGATDAEKTVRRRRRFAKIPRTVVNPDENFYFYWLMLVTISILYNLWTLIVRQSFPELQSNASRFWLSCDCFTDIVFIFDVAVQLRTGYLEQGLMVYDSRKLAGHYLRSRAFLLDLAALVPLDILQFRLGSQPMLRFPRFFKVYRAVKYYYIVESRTVWPNLWRVVNLIHILLILAHWFGCFYFLLSEAEGFQGDWVYPYRPGDYATLTRKYLGSLYWSTLTLTTIGDLPTPETNAEYVFTIVSYLIGVFIFATIVGQVGNVITNRNANRLEFERLLDGAKTYMRHHKVPGGMKRRVLRWYDYSWSRGRIQGGGDINTALGLLPDKLKTELALHVNLSVLKKVTIFQECQPEFLHDLVLKMKAYIFTPGDSICRKGEVAREMFIIADGILEVLSETGKVLTTMKAGDFFGEIGILNLDGLNKRTADVRSVGYSELFSLSREDVLTAMKDYPEAQEILQTLGRKRLMEVRCVNKKHANKHAAKEHAGDRSSNTHNNQGDSSDNSASKRIVDKLRSDVKGLKNVLRKSRTGTTRRSNESIEMQPLHGNAATGGGSGGAGSGGSGGSGGSKTPKTMLKRMPRVKSDDIHTEDEGKDNDKVPSPIGAGLPLLQRLRLLKEKQESIQEEPEPEVIGAGLPLMQRLKLLKAKEDRLAKESQSKLQVTSNQTSSSPSIVQSMSPTSPTVKAPPSPILNTTGVAGHHIKPTMRVSFKDRIRNLHHQDSKHHGDSKPSSVPGTIHETTDMKQHLLPSAPTSHGNKAQQHQSSQQPPQQPHHPCKPSTAQTLKDKIRSLGHLKADDQLKPWSKLKLATVVSLGGSYTSLNNAASEESPILKQSKRSRLKTSIPADLNLNSLVSMTPPPISSAPPTTCAPSASFLQNKILSCTAGEAASVSDSEVASGSRAQRTGTEQSGSRTIPARVRMKPKPIKLVSSEPKSYLSIDDLSPEYCGLPFVKKLKILNERQKLAELESAIKTRSLSLDCTDSNTSTASTHDLLDQLTRSQSEGSGMAHTVRSKSESPKRSDSNGLIPLSPESNETLERRQLKSILKKLSEDKAALEQRPNRDLKKLMRAQTVEGYVARHSKFTKSVTFHRNTLSSPPSSAAQCDPIEERSLFPLLSAQTATGTVPGVPHSVPAAPLTSSAASSATAQHADERLSVTTASIEQEHERYYQVLHEEHHHEEHHQQHREEHRHYHRLSPPARPTIGDDDTRNALAVISNGDAHRGFPYDPHTEPQLELEPDGADPSTRSSLSALASQRKLIKGSLEEQEFFGEVLLGIKQVIQTHMKEIQVKFQDEFFNLELEVKKRDDIISKLQNRILELEAEQQHPGLVGLQVQLPPEPCDAPYHKSGSSGSGSTGSSNELPFMRGDSLDTIFASSPHSDSDAPRQQKTRSRKPRTSPRHRQLRNRPTWDESTDQDSFERKDSPPLGSRPPGGSGGPPPPVPPRRMSATATSTTTAVTMSATTDRIRSPYRDLVISELTGNIISDSVIVNIEATSSSQSESQSENDQPYGEENEEEEEEEEDDEHGEARQLMAHRHRSRSRETEGADGDEECEDEAYFGEELEGEMEQEAEEEEAGNEEEEQEEEEEEPEEEEEEEEEELNHNDWEVRMLAAELKKRESISTDFPVELEAGGDGLVRRRSHRKRSDTDTDGSEGMERDAFGRPRSSSFDQHNLQRRAAFGRAGRAPTIAGPSPSAGPSAGSRSRGGIFKALSFDRDKDHL
uniref:Cyclic nucleotide-binding domain-containing protein n=1 Tax=Anopheles epiroticus TaxID=199890 RepID=A0A182P8N8_9DIPT